MLCHHWETMLHCMHPTCFSSSTEMSSPGFKNITPALNFKNCPPGKATRETSLRCLFHISAGSFYLQALKSLSWTILTFPSTIIWKISLILLCLILKWPIAPLLLLEWTYYTASTAIQGSLRKQRWARRGTAAVWAQHSPLWVTRFHPKAQLLKISQGSKHPSPNTEQLWLFSHHTIPCPLFRNTESLASFGCYNTADTVPICGYHSAPRGWTSPHNTHTGSQQPLALPRHVFVGTLKENH